MPNHRSEPVSPANRNPGNAQLPSQENTLQNTPTSTLRPQALIDLGLSFDNSPTIVITPQTSLRQLAQLQAHLESIRHTHAQYTQVHQPTPTQTIPHLPIQMASRLYQLTGEVLSQAIPTAPSFLNTALNRIQNAIQSVRTFLSPNRAHLHQIPTQLSFATQFAPFSETAINAGLSVEQTSQILEFQARKMGLSLSREEALALTIQGAPYLNQMRALGRTTLHTRYYQIHNAIYRTITHIQTQIQHLATQFRVDQTRSQHATQTLAHTQDQFAAIQAPIHTLNHRLTAQQLADQLTHIDLTHSDNPPPYDDLPPRYQDLFPTLHPTPSAPPYPTDAQLDYTPVVPSAPPMPTKPKKKDHVFNYAPKPSTIEQGVKAIFPKFTPTSLVQSSLPEGPKEILKTKKEQIDDALFKILIEYSETPIDIKEDPYTPYPYTPSSHIIPHHYQPVVYKPKLHPNLCFTLLYCDHLKDSTEDIISVYHQQLVQQELVKLSDILSNLIITIQTILYKVNEITGTITTLIENTQTIVELITPVQTPLKSASSSNPDRLQLIETTLQKINKQKAELLTITEIKDDDILDDLLTAGVTPDLLIIASTSQNEIETITYRIQDIHTLFSTVTTQLDILDQSDYLIDLQKIVSTSTIQDQSTQFLSLLDLIQGIKYDTDSTLTSLVEPISLFPSKYNQLVRVISKHLSRLFGPTVTQDLTTISTDLSTLLTDTPAPNK